MYHAILSIRVLVAMTVAIMAPVDSFSVVQQQHHHSPKQRLPTRMTADDHASTTAEQQQPPPTAIGDDITCFVVNDEEIVTAGEPPQVVCTSEPDEYAWFSGLDRDKMRPTDGVAEGAVECVEGASPRGIPEWECRGQQAQAPAGEQVAENSNKQ